MGKSGRAMIEALIAGETNPAKLAALADRRVKASHEEFREAPRPRDEAPSLPAAPSSGQIDALDAAMATLDTASGGEPGPLRTAVELIMRRSRASRTSAHVIVSEIGILDMSRFPSDAHLISWAGICPQRRECRQASIQSSRKGAPWLKTTLGSAPWAAVKRKQLPTGPILPHQSSARPQEGDQGRSLHPYRYLPVISRMGRCTRTSAAISLDRCSTDKQKQTLG